MTPANEIWLGLGSVTVFIACSMIVVSAACVW
jgi:hypothetical protein